MASQHHLGKAIPGLPVRRPQPPVTISWSKTSASFTADAGGEMGETVWQ